MDNHLDAIVHKLYCYLNKSGHIETSVHSSILQCPVCLDKMEPLFLNTSGVGIERIQNIWWTCRGLSVQKCTFPLNMPANVYWVDRKGDEIDKGFIPLPNLHLLPSDLKYLYPDMFPDSPKQRSNTRIPSISSSNFSSAVSSPGPLTPHPNMFQPADMLNGLLNNTETPVNERKASSFRSYSGSRLFRRVPRKKQEVYEPKMDHLVYNASNVNKKVDVFVNASAALDTMINFKFSNEKFISNINSEMCRKQLMTPTPSLGQKQKRIVGIKKDVLNDVLEVDDGSSKKTLNKIVNIMISMPEMEALENYRSRVGELPSEHSAPEVVSNEVTASSSSSRTEPKFVTPTTAPTRYPPGFKFTGHEDLDQLLYSNYKKAKKKLIRIQKKKKRGSKSGTPVPANSVLAIATEHAPSELDNTSFLHLDQTIQSENTLQSTPFAQHIEEVIAEHEADLGLDPSSSWHGNLFEQEHNSLYSDNHHYDLEF